MGHLAVSCYNTSKLTRVAGIDQEVTDPLSCQPYREIFEFFIEDFKTYKPLLSSIKNAYEVMLGKTVASVPGSSLEGMERILL